MHLNNIPELNLAHEKFDALTRPSVLKRGCKDRAQKENEFLPSQKKWTNPRVILYQWTWFRLYKETKSKIYRLGFGRLFKNKSLWDQSTWPVSGHCPLTGHYFDSYKENLKWMSSPVRWTQMGAKRRVTHLNPLLANTLFNLNIIYGL